MKSEVSIKNAIEAQFRNIQLEYNVVAYLVRVSITGISLIDLKWFTVKPLISIFSILKNTNCTYTRSSLLHQIKITKKLDLEGLKLYKECLRSLYTLDITTFNIDNFNTMCLQLCDLYDNRYCLLEMSNIIKDLKNFNLVKAKEKFKLLSQDKKIKNIDREGDYIQDYDIRLQVIKEKRIKLNEIGNVGIPTGISEFDRLVGGLMRQEWGIVAGEPGLGKTAALICFAVNAWLKGFNVYFATGEMSKEAIQFRIDSNISQISSRKFRLGDMDKKDLVKWEEEIEKLKYLINSFFEVSAFTRGFTTRDIESGMNRVQDKQGRAIDILFSDYINIMDSNGNDGDQRDWKSQAGVVWDFKSLIENFNGGIVGWSAGQIKDEFFGAEELTLDALKYARAISETAPIVCGLVRTADDILFNTMQLQILKMRNAAAPKPIILYPNFNIMNINKAPASTKTLSSLGYSELLERGESKKNGKRKY